MGASLCIHGHFYQPPREDPWLGIILPEASAAPMMHWNERITRESYAPLAFARRLDAQGNIADILNCYEWINFNVGPTLMRWLVREMPEVAGRMQAGDAHSLLRLGHGNAIAQVYHHVILPLASKEDKRCEVRWAMADFQHHFGRAPQGMWLSECAVDTPSLEVLAEEGISIVSLAPRQAKAVLTEAGESPVDEHSLNIGQGYVVQLPSGRRMNVLFYHGALSQRIAFEGLLGKEGSRYVPYLMTVALYIACSNVIGVFGVKPPTKDLDVTAALALMSIVLIEYAGVRARGGAGFLKSLAAPTPIMTPMNILEIAIRPTSLCMRLFGNVLGAFVIMELLKLVVPVFVPAVFSLYFDLFDGLIQTYVFVFLTALFMKESIGGEE